MRDSERYRKQTLIQRSPKSVNANHFKPEILRQRTYSSNDRHWLLCSLQPQSGNKLHHFSESRQEWVTVTHW